MAVRRQPIPFGKYFLLDRINIGGMAEVWRAKTFGEQGFEKLVAIKRILPNIAEDDEFITMFIDEAKITVQLTHANVAQVFDLGKIGDSYFIAMEYVAGKDLRAIFDRCRKKNEPAPIPMVCFMVAKMCEGLDYAHRKRDPSGMELHIVHRDVSPQNCLVSFEGEIKVIDFGIAKAANKATKTQAGILKGKFGYMSPEQVRGLPLDQRSDVFAAGVVLYEMLTGERLFVGDSDFSVLEKVRQVDILPPTKYNRRIPEGLEKIVLKALTKDAEDRYTWASDLADALQRFIITSDAVFSRKDLAQYMKSTFAEDVEKEKVRQAEYAEIKLPGAPAPAPARTRTGTSNPKAAPPPPPRAPAPPPPPPMAAANAMQETAPNIAEHTVIDGGDLFGDSGAKKPAGPPAAPRPSPPPPLDLESAIDEQLMSEAGAQGGNGASALAPETPIANGARPPGPPQLKARPLPPGFGQPASGLPPITRPPPPVGPPHSPQQPSSFKPRMPELDKVGDVSGGSKKKWFIGGGVGAAVLVAVAAAVLLLGGKGGILVDYEPVDARVFVDGLEVCAAAPCLFNDLKPGMHRVEIRRERYEPVAEEVDVPRGDSYRMSKVKLKAIVQNLLVSVASEPSDAEVKVDGKVVRPLGSRPPAKAEMPVGKPFEVEVSKPGFMPWRKTMTLGETDKPPVDVWAELTKLQMPLKFDSKPTGAKLVIDDKPAGKTPMQVDDLDPSVPHTVVMQKDGYKDATHTILPGTASGDIVKELEKK